ncbi:MAG TPA: hypothetical protein QF509_02345 [Rhodospirillales bacterium]|jgi:hypothetical protein|nr:hypothetical protein [Rhodospirillaceae bacterium]HJN22744.1 hypothetical protein [Rhodospirillales bacterium]|tara:strand:- start:434 stop:664 length:231 start_codon:yes stop_codon:yes gene_type:complete
MSDQNMDSQNGSGELLEAHSENHHLKNTINALRDELVNMRYEKEEAVQKDFGTANDELSSLKIRRSLSANAGIDHT